MDDTRRKCLTNISTRFKIGDWVKYSHDSSNCLYGIVIDICDKGIYTYCYSIRWLTKDPITIEEIDGIWLEKIWDKYV